MSKYRRKARKASTTAEKLANHRAYYEKYVKPDDDKIFAVLGANWEELEHLLQGTSKGALFEPVDEVVALLERWKATDFDVVRSDEYDSRHSFWGLTIPGLIAAARCRWVIHGGLLASLRGDFCSRRDGGGGILNIR